MAIQEVMSHLGHVFSDSQVDLRPLTKNLVSPAHVPNSPELDSLVKTFIDICGETTKELVQSEQSRQNTNPPGGNRTLANF